MIKIQKNYLPVYIQTLGGFSISTDTDSVSSNNQSKKTWFLLAYMATFRNKDISTAELIDVVWGNSSGTNPAGALKTLLFRARKLLEPLNIPPQELIVQQKGSYAWTNSIHIEVDIEQFDKLCAQVFASKKDTAICKEIGKQALALYKGDFLPQAAWESWAIPINTYYHNLYLNLVHLLLQIYMSEESYQQCIELCHRAIMIDSFDEDFHYNLIYSLYKTGDIRSAMEHYNHMTDRFYNEFAISPSEKLAALYKSIQNVTHQREMNLTLIQNSFLENAEQSGAFYCEYVVFKDIYLLESRTLERSGGSVYLCLFTITSINNRALPADKLAKPMEDLLLSIHDSLRRGDVCSRYSSSQYILLLPSATYENGESVLKRVVKHFSQNHTYRNLKITYSLQAVLPT